MLSIVAFAVTILALASSFAFILAFAFARWSSWLEVASSEAWCVLMSFMSFAGPVSLAFSFVLALAFVLPVVLVLVGCRRRWLICVVGSAVLVGVLERARVR